MHGKFGLLSPRGKRAAIVLRYPALFFPCVQCFCVSKPPAVRPTFFLTTDGYGIFNVRTNLGACHTHEGRSDTNKSAQELTEKLFLMLPHQGIDPRVFVFEF